MSATSSETSRSRHLVDPELAPVLDLFPAEAMDDAVLAAAREAPLLVPPPSTEITASVTNEHVAIPGINGAPDVGLEIYKSRTGPKPSPCVLHIHGGGFVLGRPKWFETANIMLAAEVGCVVVSVDYRLSPETRAPGALEDCYAALQWTLANAERLEIDPTRVGVKGESAGGGLAAALCLLARDRGEHRLAFQHLIYPMLDDRTGVGGEGHPFAGEHVWTPHNNRFAWRAFLGTEPGGLDISPYAAPARASRLADLPATFIATGALDLFLEEDLEYGRRLVREGVPCEMHVYPGAFHGFDLVPGPRVSTAMKRDSFEALRRITQPR